MAQDISIPADVAEHCGKAAEALGRHVARLEYLHELWADEDPDAENGHFWHVQIAHPEATQLRDNLAQVAEFLDWLAKFGPEAGDNHE